MSSEKQRYVVAVGCYGYGVVDLERELAAPAISASEAESMCKRFVASGPSIYITWVSCVDAGIDVDMLRRETGWETETVTKKEFKVGDRVRITSKKPSDYDATRASSPGWLCFMDDLLGNEDEVERVTEHGIAKVGGYWWKTRDLELIESEPPVPEPQVKEPLQQRRPQVGEVWRTRDGGITSGVLRSSGHSRWTLIGDCSDGEQRTWDANGSYSAHGEPDQYDLVEFVTESELAAKPTTGVPAVIEKCSPDRIGSRCWYKARVFRDGKWVTLDWSAGFMRAWSTDSDDGNIYPVAIVEDAKTCVCDVVFLCNVCFASDKPGDKK